MMYQNRFSDNDEYKAKNVIVKSSDIDFPKSDELSDKKQEFVKNIPNQKSQLHLVEYAAMIHVKFINIHPFIGSNGRVAHLIMNLVLLQAGFNITTISPVVRNDYIACLQDAQLKNNTITFTNFISEIVLKAQKEYLRIIERLK